MYAENLNDDNDRGFVVIVLRVTVKLGKVSGLSLSLFKKRKRNKIFPRWANVTKRELTAVESPGKTHIFPCYVVVTQRISSVRS